MNDTTTLAPATQPTPNKAFIVRVNPGSQKALQKNVVGIGWPNMTDMNASWSWDELKKRIRQAYPGYSNHSLGNVAGSIERFCMEGKHGCVSVGDYVLMPVDRSFHVGIVKSKVKRCDEAWAAESCFLQWQREVEWLTKAKGPIPRGAVHSDLEIRLKARQTCIDASDCTEFISKALSQESYAVTPFSELVREKSKKAVIDALTTINDRRLEEIICGLCAGVGAKLLPKNDSTPGDADVQADYPVMVGNQPYFIRVLYQVKKHSGKTGGHGIQQLINRIKSLNADDENKKDSDIIAYKGCLVTTADDVKENVERKAIETPDDQLEIDIITIDKLADWILDAGLSNLKV